MTLSRRGFLASPSALALAQPGPASPSWVNRPMRWAQVAFTEDDPGQFDLALWLDYFKRIHADAACLSAGGLMAFYPTKIPLHYKSKYLGDSDPFGAFTAGCRTLGMNVIARTDPHACTEEAARAHPEWVARNADGSMRRHWADPSRYVTCALGPFNFDFMTQVTREIVTLYKVDGVFSNRWHGHGVCYCASCQKLFREYARGLELPRTLDPKDPARRQWIVWNQVRLFELWEVWDRAIREINPDACYIPNSGGGALSELDMKQVGARAPILFADRQARRGVMAPWANGKNAKEYRATLGSKPVGGIFSIGVEEPYRWKDSVQSEAEIRAWAHNGIAHGLRPWFTKFNAKPFDKRWMPVVEGIYNWHHRNEKYLRNTGNLARAAILYSQQTAHYYGGERARERVEDPQLGFYQALVESRIPFEMAHEGLLDAASLDRYQVLILPNIAALSSAQCQQLEQYVARGGAIVATSESSLYDEWGQRRSDFGLAKLFGCSYAGRVEERMQNSYLTLEHGLKHELLKGLENMPRVINGVRRVEVRGHDSSYRAPLTLVPTYPDLPMEMVYSPQPRTDIPAIYCRAHGKGRAVYFPMDLDRTFWEVLSADHLALLRRAIEWAAPSVNPLRVTGPGLLDLAYWRQASSLAVHIVNLSNPMAMKGPFRETFPVGPLELEAELPPGANVAKIHLLTAGTPARWTPAGPNRIRIQVPLVELHEVAAIDLAGS